MDERSRSMRLRRALLGLVLAASGPACGARTLETGNPPKGPDRVPESRSLSRIPSSIIDRIDLLLAVDNSRSMADKQQILGLAVPDLVLRLVNPLCVDAGGRPAASQPPSALAPCPPQTAREFQPVTDIHIGIISSSLGGHGSDACKVDSNAPGALTNDDHGHLLSRGGAGGLVPTYQEKGFLAWDPRGELAPPGESSDGALISALTDMVTGVGQVGCGYESQLESVYRFLVDPEPYDTIEVALSGPDQGSAVPLGVDTALLQQRGDFLRPDSLLAVVILTDENDCSIREGGQYFLAGQILGPSGPYHLPAARSACADDPGSPCCRSCGQPPAEGCPDDPGCATLTDAEDDVNLRCFDQKRRFGIDFLYPVDRYVQAFTAPQIANRKGQLVANPIFSDLVPKGDLTSVRDPGSVLVAGIVGVPWQDIARDPGDLSRGFKASAELAKVESNGLSTWDAILGDPAVYAPPRDPHMVESVRAREGTNPVTGDSMVPPGAPPKDPISGAERSIPDNDDLQYACTFPLPAPHDCSPGTEQPGCDCGVEPTDNPICAVDASTGLPTVQVGAKAYPGLRELEVLRGLGDQGLVASICPKQIADSSSPEFGYRPAVAALVDRLKTAIDGQCLPRALAEDASGRVSCLVVEARRADGACTCDPQTGRRSLSAELSWVPEAVLADAQAQSLGLDCSCEVLQLDGADLAACQSDPDEAPVVDGHPVNGFCYVDATKSPPTGDPVIVARCPDDEKRMLRFVGAGRAVPGAALFVSCSGE